MTDESQTEATQDDGFPTAWKPDPGAVIVGTLQGVEVIDPGGQGPYPCLTIQTADGSLRAVHAFHQVLRNGIARRRPKIGDELTIVYRGKKAGGAYGGYHDYAVSGGQAQEVNWDSFLPESERQADAVPIAPAPIPMSQEQVDAMRQAQADAATRETQASAEKTFGTEVPF